MKISIVVPTYREEENILNHYQECIRVLDKVRECYPEFDTYEYFVIDNCSDDKTVEKVLSMRERGIIILNYLLMTKTMGQYYHLSLGF